MIPNHFQINTAVTQWDHVWWSHPEHSPRARGAGGQRWSAGECFSPGPAGSGRTRLQYNLQVRAQNCSHVGLDFLFLIT